LILVEFIFDVIGYRTSRLLLPMLTFQRVKVDGLSSSQTGYNWLGFRRLFDGASLRDPNSAGWIGALFWALVLVIIVAWV
jgi:hypothetical protein